MRMLFLFLAGFCTCNLLGQDQPGKSTLPYPTQIEEVAAKAKKQQAVSEVSGPKSVIAIGVDLLNRPQQYERSTGGNYSNDYIIRTPRFSLLYQREVLSKLAPLQAELQLRYYRNTQDKISDGLITRDRGGWTLLRDYYHETLNMSILYGYPGLNFILSNNKEFMTYAGAGMSIALPLQLQRTMSIRFENYPEYPQEQEIRDFQEVSTGYYVQTGLQARFPVGIGIGVALRYESLPQQWANVPKEEVVSSRSFWVFHDDLAIDQQFMLQCYLLYTW